MKNSFWKLAELLSGTINSRNVESVLIDDSHLVDHFKPSPNGQYSAMAIACEDRRVLAIVDNRSHLPKRTFDCGSHRYIQRFEWLSNDEVAFTRSGESDSPTTRQRANQIFVGLIAGEGNGVIAEDSLRVLS